MTDRDGRPRRQRLILDRITDVGGRVELVFIAVLLIALALTLVYHQGAQRWRV